MPASKLTIEGNSYIGTFAVATDTYSIIANNIPTGKEELMQKTLYTRLIKTSMNGSQLVGLFIAANSNGILLPGIADRDEIMAIKKELPDLSVEVLDTDLNALRNNILVNDKIAVINPRYQEDDIRAIRDVLGVEVLKMGIGGFNTVGANNILTNKGFVVNNRVSESEMDMIKEATGMDCEQSTANTGSLNIGLCVIANSHGILVGSLTSGFEYARIASTLDIQG